MADLSEKRELYEAAKDVYEDKAFKAAVEKLQHDWLVSLINGTEMEERVVAKLRVLDGVVGALRSLMSDYTVELKQGPRRA